MRVDFASFKILEVIVDEVQLVLRHRATLCRASHSVHDPAYVLHQRGLLGRPASFPVQGVLLRNEPQHPGHLGRVTCFIPRVLTR